MEVVGSENKGLKVEVRLSQDDWDEINWMIDDIQDAIVAFCDEMGDLGFTSDEVVEAMNRYLAIFDDIKHS